MSIVYGLFIYMYIAISCESFLRKLEYNALNSIYFKMNSFANELILK